MDHKSRRARKLAASGVTALGLAAALALSVPTAASAQHRVDHNCGNFDHADPVFGAPYDGHHRHRGAVHPAGYRLDAPVDPRDDHGTDEHGTDEHGTDHRDADDSIGHHADNNADPGGEHRGDVGRDHHDQRDNGDQGDRDERDSAHHGTWNGNGGGGDEGSYNCDNFDHRGKQMYIPPGLFDDGDGAGPHR